MGEAAPLPPPEQDADPTEPQEPASLVLVKPEDLSESAPLVPMPIRLGRVPPPKPAATVVAPPDQLAQVLQKFGPEARDDVAEVLDSWPARRNPTAALDALTRLLAMDPGEIQRSAGACFRSYLRLACDGKLRLAKTHPRGGTIFQRLERQRDDAAQRGDLDAAHRYSEQLFRLGRHASEQARALQQLTPAPELQELRQELPAPPPPAPRLPRPTPRLALAAPAQPVTSPEHQAAALRAMLSLPLMAGRRAELERELAEVEAALRAREPAH